MRKNRNNLLRRTKDNIFLSVLWVIMFVWCVAFIGLLIWAFSNSLKDEYDWFQSSLAFPPLEFLDWKNYVTAFQKINVPLTATKTANAPELLMNTLIYSVCNAVVSEFTALLATYILVRYKGRVKFVGILWTIYLIVRYMPVSISLGSELKMLKTLGLYDNFLGNILYNAGCFGGGFLFYYAAWRGFGNSLPEAAEIDGAGNFRIFLQIMLPLMLSTSLFFVVSKIIGLWNDYRGPMVYLPSHPTLSYALWRIQFSVETGLNNIPAKLAGLLLLSIPPFILFLIFRKPMLNGISLDGGVKG